MAEKTVKALPLVPQQYDPVNESINRRTIEQAIQDVNSEIGHVKDMQESGISKAVKRHIFLLMGASHCCFNGGSISMMLTALAGIKLPDNQKIFFGDSNDMEIYHDSNNSIIKDAGAGNLELHATNLVFKNSAGDSQYASFFNGGAVTLRYAGAPRVSTTSSGIDVTGSITTDGMTTSADINFGDDDKALFGSSNDLKIYHSANNQSYIHEVGSGDLNILATNLKLQDAGGSTKVVVNSTGIDVTGTVTATDEFRGEVVNYASNQDAPYLIAGTSGYTGATTNWNTYGFQHRIKTNANGLARITIDTNSAEAFNVTNNNRIGIGTSSPQSKLTLENGLQRINATDGSSDARIQFTMTNGSNYPSGWIGIPNWNKDGLYIFGPTANGSEVAALYTEARWQFHTGNSERARLTNAGDLLVGKTTTSTGVAGARFSANGFANVTRDGAECINFNRLTSDGTIIDLRKDSTTVGKIGSYSSGLDIVGSSYGVRFAGSTIFPVTSAGSVSDNVVSLGYSGGRFKDLYLIGKAQADTYQFAQNSSATGATDAIYRATTATLAFKTGSSERMRLNTTGLGIGTSSPARTAVINSSGTTTLQITNDTTGVTTTDGLQIKHYTSGATQIWNYENSYIAFGTNNLERGRFDQSGNLLVGTTNTFPPSDSGNEGVAVKPDNIAISRNASTPLFLDRMTSDGTIVDFRKDNTTVGSIGVIHGNNLFIGAPSHSGLQFGGTIIYPTNGSTGDATNGTIDLGGTSTRFKDFYLSGKAYVGSMNVDAAINDGIKISSAVPYLFFNDTDSANSYDSSISHSGTSLYVGGATPAHHVIFRNKASFGESARIATDGQLLIGKTATDNTTVGTRINGAGFISSVVDGDNALLLNRLNSDGSIVLFRKDGTTVGSISVTGSATAYNTSSDARLKDVTGEARGLEVISKLNPVAYNWKADGKADEGLIAQEVKELAPNAVSETEEGYYQMDYSKLVTSLIKAVQEQQEQIESLKSEINKLKGK